ncbi:hypothetical protein ACFLYT_01660 [Nanoarchaeota archaeon]
MVEEEQGFINRNIGKISTAKYKGFRRIWNSVPVIRRIRLPNSPYKKSGEHDIEKELNDEIRLNEQKVKVLNSDIEHYWITEFAKKTKAKTDKAGLSIGPYLDNVRTNIEFNLFLENKNVTIPKLTDKDVEGEFVLEPLRIVDGAGEEEILTVLGRNKILEINKFIDGVWKRISKADNKYFSDDPDEKAPMTLADLERLRPLKESIKSALDNIFHFEDKFYERLKNIKAVLDNIENMRDNITTKKERPSNVHYKHTYKIISPFYIDDDGKEHFFKDYCSANGSKFKTTEGEVDFGLDERGKPLEVYEDGGKWYVLLDKWAHDINRNDWQKDRVQEKADDLKNSEKEDPEEKEKDIKKGKAMEEEFEKFMLRSEFGPKGREVPAEYVKDINMFDTVAYVHNEWDPYRDDYRDGRYHPHSRTVHDYILAQERGIVSTKDIKSISGWDSDPITRKPIKLKNLPGKEKLITRSCLSWNVNKVGGEYKYTSKKGRERKPSHLSPAFDRAARILGKKSEDNFSWVHWGRLYYYDTCDAITEWTENPNPHMSTRGIAKYIINRVIEDTNYSLEETNRVLEKKKYDFGIRKPPGNFTNRPLRGAEGILKYGPHARE